MREDTADVTLCIPAWQAQAFIDRTLRCARGQTHGRVRIAVSIDHGDDATEAICRAHARDDARVEVHVQQERLGWSRNANFLLDRVRSEFFCFYFHDDIIEPDYVQRLRDALLARPDAASAHCDVQLFGAQLARLPGHDYDGNAARRLVDFLIGPVKGAPLRSLTRSTLLRAGLRFPQIGRDAFWRCHPYLLGLLGAGPALHIPHVLYRRWMRDGGVTATWDRMSVAELHEGQRASARRGLALIDALDAPAIDKALAREALALFMLTLTREHEHRLGAATRLDPASIAPSFGRASSPSEATDPTIRSWMHTARARLAQLETRGTA